MIKFFYSKNKNKMIQGVILLVLIGLLLLAGYYLVSNLPKKDSDRNNSETSQYQYKAFKPTFKLSEDSPGDDYDFTQDMEYQESIYHRKITTYQEYQEVKNRWNEILDMEETDFANYFMVITAIENTSMLGLSVDKIEADETTLYISLKLVGNLIDEDFNSSMVSKEEFEEYEKTCISYIIPRSMEREKIQCIRNYREDEKDFDPQMQLAEGSGTAVSFKYRDQKYREFEGKSYSGMRLIPEDWKDCISYNFTVTKDMPQIDFSTWENLGDDFYAIPISEYSEYLKWMNQYKVKHLYWYDFKYIYAIVVVRANNHQSIVADEIKKDESGNDYLPVHTTDTFLGETSSLEYPGMVIVLPNYRRLEENNFHIRVQE